MVPKVKKHAKKMVLNGKVTPIALLTVWDIIRYLPGPMEDFGSPVMELLMA
jgi:hypothetical protein